MDMLRPPKRLAVLASGGGTNLQAIIDAIQENRLDAEICLVAGNRPGAGAFTRAEAAGIPTCLIDHTTFSNREDFDEAMQNAIDAHQPDYVVLAGFMRILTPGFVNHYAGRLLNIHPSLLPAYPGLHTHRRAIEAGDHRHGASVHFVTQDLDGGPVILQGEVPVFPEDTPNQLADRVLVQEHVIYPMVLQWLCEDRLKLVNDKVILDETPLGSQGLAFNAPH